MSTIDILKIIFGIIASIGSAGGIIWFFVKLSANTLADQYKEKIKHDFGKQLESYKTQLDVLKATTLKYNDKQFELYLDLWRNLQELKYATIDLWNEISPTHYRSFKRALQTTDRQIETSSLLIEGAHYTELRETIRVLREYEMGKVRLGDQRNRFNPPENEIQEMIEYNRERKDAYLEIIERIRLDIQSKISGRQENN
jgi:hypothetical protein